MYQRTRPPENSGPLQKSFWSAQSWIFVQDSWKNRAMTPEGGGNVPNDGGPEPLFGRSVIREAFLPRLFFLWTQGGGSKKAFSLDF